MARKKFDEAFRAQAISYYKDHPEKTIKQSAADLEIGYSTLRRWITESEANAKAREEAVVSVEKVVPENVPAEEVTEEVVEAKIVEEKKVVETPVKVEEPPIVKVEEVCAPEIIPDINLAQEVEVTSKPKWEELLVAEESVEKENTSTLSLYYKKAVLSVKEQLLKRKIKKLLK